MITKNKFYKYAQISFLWFSVIFVCACTTVTPKHKPPFSVIESSVQEFIWKEIAEGISAADIFYKDYPLLVHAVKIDLTNQKLKITTTDSTTLNKKDKTLKRETSLQFAKRNKVTVALNAAFFRAKSLLFSPRAEPIGLHIYNGEVIHHCETGFASLCFLENNAAKICESEIPVNTVFAVTGFKMILKNNKAIVTKIHPIEDSRTCVGISEDGQTMILFFAEAENKIKSRGITYDQAAFFMQKLGAYNALHLDGGGSSSLIIKINNKYKIIAPTASILGLRKVATNLGFIIID